MNLEPWQLALGIAGALLVGLSKTGIPGLGLLFVVMFANVIPAKQASGFVLPLLIFGDVVAVISYRAHAKWVHVFRLMPWTAAGVGLGFLAMRFYIDDRGARVLIGGIILVMVAVQLWRRTRLKPEEIEEAPVWFAPTLGVLVGFTTLVANAAGPLMVIYLLAMRLPKMEYVGTGAVFFLLLNCFKVPFMVGLGLITMDSFGFNLMLAPAVLLGAMLGRRLLPKINQKAFETIALAMSAAAGLKLLF